MSKTRPTIFIIDDDESVRRALRRLMESMRLNVESFATAEEFLQTPTRPAPGCIILDVHLPGLSGLDLQERLNAEGRSIHIVFITAYGDDQVCELAMRGGAIACFKSRLKSRPCWTPWTRRWLLRERADSFFTAAYLGSTLSASFIRRPERRMASN